MSKLSSLAVAICLAACARGATAQAEKATAPSQAIDPSWLSVDATTRTATFDLIAGLTGANGALNFNGFKDGGLALTVPVGWTVVMHFRNHDGMLPTRRWSSTTCIPSPSSRLRQHFPRLLRSGWPRESPLRGGMTFALLRIRGGPT